MLSLGGYKKRLNAKNAHRHYCCIEQAALPNRPYGSTATVSRDEDAHGVVDGTLGAKQGVRNKNKLIHDGRVGEMFDVAVEERVQTYMAKLLFVCTTVL